MNLHFLALYKSTSEGFLAVLVKIEYDFVPSIIKFERHRALEGFYPCNWLIIAGNEGAFNVFIIEDGDFESEIFIKLYYGYATFFASSTRMGNFIFMDAFFWLG